jgi:uncharacterized repeat protein (TIGR01451 family)
VIVMASGLFGPRRFGIRPRSHHYRPDVEAMEARQLLATFTVTGTGDSGGGTLRQAILDSNASPGPDLINFAIAPGGVRTIRPTAPLPDLTDPVVLDATSQPGFAGRPLIELDGSGIVSTTTPPFRLQGISGLRITGGNSTVRGLVINRFTGSGIVLQGSGRNVVQGNFVGTDVGGELDLGNSSDGITVVDSRGNQIGGPTAAARNVISANDGNGILLISGTGRPGLAGGNQVQGNFIGTDAGGTLDLGNGGQGLFVTSSSNLIGGSTPAEGNTIAFNGGGGVLIGRSSFFSPDPDGDQLLSNSIFANLALGIDLGGNGVGFNDIFDNDAGPNRLQNTPELTAAYRAGGGTTVEGRLSSTPDTSFVLQFFSVPTPDPSGFGEGQMLLGATNVTTDLNGVVNFTTALPPAVTPGQFVTATATDPNGNTSEFSRALRVTAAASADLVVSLIGFQAGDRTITYQAAVSNSGPATATGVTLTDALPAGLTFVSAESTRGTATSADGTVTAALGTLQRGETATVTIIARPTRSGTSANTVQVAADQADPQAANNTAEATVVVPPEALDVIPPTIGRQQLVVAQRAIRAIVLSFSEPLDGATAEDLSNYALRRLGRRSRTVADGGGRSLPIGAAAYDAESRTVTLTPRTPLRLGTFYQLTVNGTGAPGITDASGNVVDGDQNGLPDGIFRSLVGRGTPTRPVDLQRGLPTPPRLRRTRRAVPAGPVTTVDTLRSRLSSTLLNRRVVRTGR